MHKVTVTYTFDEYNKIRNISVDEDQTQLSRINLYDFLEALASVTIKAIDANKAQKQTENLLDELNIQRDENP